MREKKYFPGYFLLLLGFAVVGMTVLYKCTEPWGVGLGGDAGGYIRGARSIMEGKGYVWGLRTEGAITNWPPLYSLCLAAMGLLGIDPVEGARYFNILLFGGNVLMIGLVLKKHTGSDKIALIGAWLISVSRPMLEVHTNVMSEPLFILLSFMGYSFLIRYLSGELTRYFFYACVFIGLACLTRYSGISFIAAGTIVILLMEKINSLRRVKDCGTFILISSLPLGIWLLRNYFHTREITNRTFNIHPPSLVQFQTALSTVSNWFLPAPTSVILRDFVLMMIVIVLLSASLTVIKKEMRSSYANGFQHMDNERKFIVSIIIFILSYIGLLLAYITFNSANMPPSNRLLLPLFVGCFMVFLAILHRFVIYQTDKACYRRGMIVAAIYLLCFSIIQSGKSLSILSSEGLGYAGRAWKTSDTIRKVKTLPLEAMIYTNRAGAVYLLTGRFAFSIPQKYSRFHDRRGNAPNIDKNYLSRLSMIKETIKSHLSYVVYFDKERNWFLPDENELREQLSLALVERFSDGAIYRASADLTL